MGQAPLLSAEFGCRNSSNQLKFSDRGRGEKSRGLALCPPGGPCSSEAWKCFSNRPFSGALARAGNPRQSRGAERPHHGRAAVQGPIRRLPAGGLPSRAAPAVRVFGLR